MTNEQFLQQFGRFIDAPNGIQKLREMILQLAVQGRLILNDPNDDASIVILDKVIKDSSASTKSGKGKKSKPLQEITDDDVPYTKPEGWGWARLGDVVEVLDSIRKPVKKADRKPGPYPYYGASGVVDYVSDYLFDEPLVLIGEDGAKWGAGENTAFPISGKTWVNNHAHVLRPNKLVLNDKFVVCALVAMDLHPFITGMTVPKLNQARLNSIILPIPPLSEQHRIVVKVDELMALCDQLEAERNAREATHQRLIRAVHHPLTEAADASATQTAWYRIRDNFSGLYKTLESVQALRQTILQIAVQGELVSQDSSDEPATVLLDKICAEKDRLIKEGVIRKSKDVMLNRSDVSTLPAGWVETLLDKITIIGTGTTPSKAKDDYYGGKIAWVTSAATSGEYIDRAETLITEKAVSECRLKTYQPGTLIVALYGQGKTRGQVSELAIPATINQACASIGFIPGYESLKPFLKLSLKKQYAEMREMAAGGAQPNLNVQKIKERVILLPPLSEQKRIVAKVDELMALCDQLEANIQDKNDTAACYAEASVKELVA